MSEKDVIDAFVHNFDEHPDNPHYAQKLQDKLFKAVEEELHAIFPLQELTELQWEYIRNRVIEMINNAITITKVKYVPQEIE